MAVDARKQRVYDREHFRRDRRFLANANCISGHCVQPHVDFGPDIEPDLKWVTFLREPVKRYLSNYIHQYGRSRDTYRIEIDEWAKKFKRSNFQVRWLAGEENLERAKEVVSEKMAFVGLTERFDESLILLKHFVGMPELAIHYGATRNQAVKPEIYDKIESNKEKFDGLLQEENALDIELYGWVKNRVFPEQCLAAFPESGELERELAGYGCKRDKFRSIEKVSGLRCKNIHYKLVRLAYRGWVRFTSS